MRGIDRARHAIVRTTHPVAGTIQLSAGGRELASFAAQTEPQRISILVRQQSLEALELGLTCGAEFDLLIEPISLHASDPAVAAYESAARISRSGRTAFHAQW